MHKSIRMPCLMILTAISLSLVSARAKDAEQDKPHEIKIKDMAFDPDKLEISAGETVQWTNDDDRDHTVVCKQKESGFKSGNLGNGDTFEQKFEKAGKFSYVCSYHPRMKGTITVKAK